MFHSPWEQNRQCLRHSGSLAAQCRAQSDRRLRQYFVDTRRFWVTRARRGALAGCLDILPVIDAASGDLLRILEDIAAGNPLVRGAFRVLPT